MENVESQKNYRVLIVDNLDHERYSIKRWILHVLRECEFLEADSVESAGEILEYIPPLDLAIIDLEMDDKVATGGLEVVNMIKKGKFHEFCPRTAVIVLTVHGELREKALKSGADSFICKLRGGVQEELKLEIQRLIQP